jgi:DNA-binding CsgD family transcriptional regulator/tetratricopeptide (TPR) repeat protein
MCGDAGGALREAAAVLDEPGLEEDIYAAGQLARLLAMMAHQEFAAARAPAVAILAAAKGSDDGSLAGALTTMGSVAWTEGRVEEAIALLRAAIVRADRGRFAERAMHPRQSLSVPLGAVGEFDEAASLLRRDLADIEVDGDRGWAVGAMVRRARLHLASGQLPDAVADADAALTLARDIGARLFVPLACTTLALAALRLGDLDAAATEVERCQDEPWNGQFELNLAVWIRARIAAAREGPVLAVKTLAGLFDNLPANKRILLEEPELAGWLVRSALAAGHRSKAAAVVAAVEHLAVSNPGFATVGAVAQHARGLLDGDAGALLQASADHAHPWVRGSAAEDACAVMTAAGRDRLGLAALEAAIALYEQSGAEHDAARAQRRRRELLAGSPRQLRGRPASGWFSLTPGEREISALVAQGLTNRQIAQRLFVSRHTVDFHLRHIFRKVGVNSRVELVRLSDEFGNSWRRTDPT